MVGALVGYVETLRQEVVRKHMPAGLDVAQQAAVDQLTKALAAKMLHRPITHLKANPDDEAASLMMSSMFGIDPD
jgi:glutamyl-tRNA reductase